VSEDAGSTSTLAEDALHCNENPIYVFLFWDSAASAPISTFMCLWAICIVPGSVYVHISSSRIGRPIVEIYKWLTDAWMWKLVGLRPRYSFSGNICFKISVFCLCSVTARLNLIHTRLQIIHVGKISSTRCLIKKISCLVLCPATYSLKKHDVAISY
jgi:hypothetical protein